MIKAIFKFRDPILTIKWSDGININEEKEVYYLRWYYCLVNINRFIGINDEKAALVVL